MTHHAQHEPAVGAPSGEEVAAASVYRLCCTIAVALAVAGLVGWIGAILDIHGVAAAGLLLFPAVGLIWSAVLFRFHLRDVAPVLVLWAGFTTVTCGLVLLTDPFPFPRPDGPYVYKQDSVSVSLQRWAGQLPPDNLLPTAVAVALVDDVDFRQTRPFMPGQEVTNRPIGAALVISAVLRVGDDPLVDVPVGAFTYVGTDWPDITTHITPTRERVGLLLGVLMNSLLLIPLYGHALLLIGRARWAIVGTLASICTPLVVTQTVFTWPKAASGFFLLAAALGPQVSWQGRKLSTDSVLQWVPTGVLLGLAWWMHPMGGLLIPAVLIWIGKSEWLATLKQWVAILGGVAITIAPWFLWKTLLDIPSDLFSQNQASDNFIDAVQIRLANLLATGQTSFVTPTNRLEMIHAGLVTTVWACGGATFAVFALLLSVDVRRSSDSAILRRWISVLRFGIVSLVLVVGVLGVSQVVVYNGLVAVLPVLCLVAVGIAVRLTSTRSTIAMLSIAMGLPFTVQLLWTFQFLGNPP
jgi:hypothetical protein